MQPPSFNIGLDLRAPAHFALRQLQGELLARSGSIASFREHWGLLNDKPANVFKRLEGMTGSSVFWCTEHEALAWNQSSVLYLVIRPRSPQVSFLASVWAVDEASGAATLARLLDILDSTLAPPAQLNVDWAYRNGLGMSTTRVQEHIGDQPLATAYPWLHGGLARFCQDAIRSPEPVLILYGKPGVGKTRLIRHLLAVQAKAEQRALNVLYTTDAQAVQSDELFVDYMTQSYDAMVIEDADHLLMPRSEGNQHLHRFLAISDGFLQPRGRRLIFSTNLPSRLDIDEALTRPGRCFGCFEGRQLYADEACALVVDLVAEPAHRARANATLGFEPDSRHTLAEVYAAVRQTKWAEHGSELSQAA
jgi:hypothetical protein